jgi:hypothetical protein
MTEAEWLTCTDPEPMLDFLGKANERKLRLFACAYFRKVWSTWNSSETQEAWNAIDVAERYADGLASDEQLQVAHGMALVGSGWDDLGLHFMYVYAGAATSANVCKALAHATESHYAALTAPQAPPIIAADRMERCKLLRDIFSNPFRSIALESAWLSSTVRSLAQKIYEERAFNRMAELAGALKKSWCDEELILSHCWQPGEHVLGCWVVDLVLAKG